MALEAEVKERENYQALKHQLDQAEEYVRPPSLLLKNCGFYV